MWNIKRQWQDDGIAESLQNGNTPIVVPARKMRMHQQESAHCGRRLSFWNPSSLYHVQSPSPAIVWLLYCLGIDKTPATPIFVHVILPFQHTQFVGNFWTKPSKFKTYICIETYTRQSMWIVVSSKSTHSSMLQSDLQLHLNSYVWHFEFSWCLTCSRMCIYVQWQQMNPCS